MKEYPYQVQTSGTAFWRFAVHDRMFCVHKVPEPDAPEDQIQIQKRAHLWRKSDHHQNQHKPL
jgi:hypothetical protein